MKRTMLLQASVRIFAEKGYHAATIRDIVKEAGVAIGTFYFYFQDKETLFVDLYDETADFLLKSIQQALTHRVTLPQQIQHACQTYINLALYDPAIIQLLLVGGIGAVPSLASRRVFFREKLINSWQMPLDRALDKHYITPQNTRRSAEALVGAFDEIVLNLLAQPNPELETKNIVSDMTSFALRAVAYTGDEHRA